MSFIDTLTFGIISGEAKALREMSKATTGWYNELTKPVLPLLRAAAEMDRVLTSTERQVLKAAALKLYEEHKIENCGDALASKMGEMMQSHGIPWFSGRHQLIRKTSEYIESGLFLKAIAFSSLDSADSRVLQRTISDIRRQHSRFERKKNALISQITRQLGRLGYHG